MEIKVDVLGRYGEFGSARTIVKDGVTWYCANDICDILLYKENNRSSILSRYCRNVVKFKISTPSKGGEKSKFSRKSQFMNFINKDDLISLVQHSKTVTEYYKLRFLEVLGITSDDSIILSPNRKEIEFMLELKNILKKVYYLDSISQYQCGEYFIDLYIPSINLAIEYDENDHKYYDQEKEKVRQNHILNSLNCRLLRLSDKYTHNENLIKVMDILNEYYFKELLELYRTINTRIILQPIPYPVNPKAEPLIRFV